MEKKYFTLEDPDSYRFAKYCQRLLPGQHSAKLITGLDTSRDPGMLIHRKLAYFLYPIDIRNIRKEPVDSLIIFAVKDATQLVPEDFQISGKYNESSLIAVKKSK